MSSSTSPSASSGSPTPAKWEHEPRFPIKDNEFYGVAMRKGVPGLCLRLNAVIEEFLGSPWDNAFEDHLAEIEPRDPHKPRSVDPALCR